METGGINNSGYWKIAGLRPAIFNGTPGNLEDTARVSIQFELLENSRPPACYFQWNSWKLGKSIILVIARVKITCSVWEFFINLTSKLQEMYEKIRKNILLIL